VPWEERVTREEGRTSLVVSDVATREYERSGLLVERRELSLEGKVHGTVTSDIARSTSAGTVSVEGLAARGRRVSGREERAAKRKTYWIALRVTG
jgi:hypothetical protein